MGIQTKTLEYRDGDTGLEAYMAWDDTGSVPLPCILIAHTWAGRTQLEESKAEQLAELGYAAVAVDLYGKGVRGQSRDENAALMKPLMDDRARLQQRMKLAVTQCRKQKEVDAAKVAAMGFCFGGLCVLDLARTGADILGVASFHGLFSPPGNLDDVAIRCKVLALHGWDDPMAMPQDVLALADELTNAGADWQIHAYGNTMHAFTNPAAEDEAHGTVYDADADRRSWQSLQLFLAEIFHAPAVHR